MIVQLTYRNWSRAHQEDNVQQGYHLPEENGLCKPCTDGVDYTSFPNRLPSCRRCSVCKEDSRKIVKSPCTLTRNTECQCKPGTFEDRDSTEICQTCSNCTDGEDEVTPCTPETNRKCVSKTAWASHHNLLIGLLVTVIFLSLGGLIVWRTKAWWQGLLFKIRTSGCERDLQSANTLLGLKTSNDSHHNTKNLRKLRLCQQEGSCWFRQTELTPLPFVHKLVPHRFWEQNFDLLQEHALKLIFEYCPNEVPFNSWDGLMRQMGLTDNQIHVVRAETPASRDVLYQMLLKWLQQTGRSASINHLLDALEAVGERCALEKIEDYAVKSGKFIYQSTTAQAGEGTQDSEPGASLGV
ncbi:Tumor necrosis factor receptor superfamily member 10B [Apodemus speciosus]|uniref:Tumor necrosis factor receptor superfamily member 10B n=1 Tax=Apodemus speciosus TaxID=105296 RepID=A0ABQ0FIF5_APOSI